MKGKIATVERTGEFATEHEKGPSVIKDWQQKDGHLRHHLVVVKNAFGCMYLPNARRFILNNGRWNIQILEEGDFAEVKKFTMEKSMFGSKRNFPKKFIGSHDESLVISNGAFSYLNLYTALTSRELRPNQYIWGISAVEMMEDEYRIAKANYTTGIVTIYRVNANINIDICDGHSSLPAVASVEKLFSGYSPHNGAGLLSGGASGGGLSSGSSRSKDVSSPSSKKLAAFKEKELLKPAKKGKKIQKIQVRSAAATKKKKEKSALSPAKKGKKALKAESSTNQNKNMMEAVGIRRKKKTKEERVWVALPSAAEDEKKRGRSLKKAPKTQENKSSKKGKRKTDLSKDKGNRSRSKSKSVIRKK